MPRSLIVVPFVSIAGLLVLRDDYATSSDAYATNSGVAVGKIKNN
jgi:hypothetical protein